MKPVSIVTDSTASLPEAFIDTLPIVVVPNILNWGGTSYEDGIDITPQAFYERLRSEPENPTTSQVPPFIMGEAFDRLHAEGRAVLAVLLSSKLSGTYLSGRMAATERPDQEITLVDSLSSGMGMGWAAVAAARAAQGGADLAECQAVAEKALANAGVLGMVNTLKYLHRAGRIGGARRFLGSALNLKPILEISAGEIQGIDRVRTRGKALDRMADLLEERIAGRSPLHLAVMHANDPETAAVMVERLKTRFAPVEIVVSDLSPNLGINFGEGTIGLCYLAGM